MTDEHREAIRQGRTQANTVKAYLQSLGVERRGRRSDPGSLKKRLTDVESRLAQENDVLRILELRQERLDLQQQLGSAAGASSADPKELEQKFITVAADFAARKGITYAAFREMGVPPKVLSQAGIKRS